MSDESVNKCAILMLALGHEEAAEVFKYLGPKEVQKLGMAMASVGNVSKERIESVLHEFHSETEGRISLADSDDYIRSVLKKALGDDKAAHLIDRILQGNDSAGIESLKWLDSASVAEMIRNEHPQIIATIMVHLERDHASEILNLLPERLRNDVMVRIATLEGAQPMAMRELNEVLTQLLSGGEVTKKTTLGGVKAAADILNFMGGAVEASVLANIREHDADLAQKIQDQMFTFDNILALDDRSVQLLLREVQSETLIVALKAPRKSCVISSSRTCPAAPLKRSRKTWKQKARFVCPRSKPNRRKSSRSCANWSTKARSCSAAKAATKRWSADAVSP